MSLLSFPFGWRRVGNSMRIAEPWHIDVEVSNVGPLRRRVVRNKVIQLMQNRSGGSSPGEQIRNGLRLLFNRDAVRNWYVIPGDGRRVGDESNVNIRYDASFFIVE